MTDNTVREAPRVLGVEMRVRMAGACPSWSCCFGILYVSITENGGTAERPLCEARVGSKTVAMNALSVDCIATIEREILTIRDAIPAPEPKPCWSCGATLPGPSPEESKRKQEAWEAEQKGGTDG